MKIAIVTSAVGLKKASLEPPEYGGADYYFFSDLDFGKIPGWITKTVYSTSWDERYKNRRAAKIPKILTHYLLPEYDYYIWHDYSHKLAIDPKQFISNYLGNNDFAFFKHPDRSSWHTELDVILRHRLDHENLLIAQRDYYNNLEVKKNRDFYACGAFVRKNNDVANKTCSLWYEHVCKFSSRDQLSLPAAIQIHKPKIGVLPGCPVSYNKLIPQYRASLRSLGLAI